MVAGVDSLEDLRGLSILVFGAGGGGDVLGALHLYLRLKKLGAKPLLGSIVWERLQVDPFPGPIPIEQLVNARAAGSFIALVNPSSWVDRYGYRVVPQVVRASRVIGEEVLFIDASKGGEGVRRALREAVDELGIDVVIGLDSGGDALAVGCEPDLWSPLADAMSLYALESLGSNSLLAVLGPGGDGELPTEYVLSRIAAVAREGGLVGVYGLSRSEAVFMERVADQFVSEASKAPLWGFRGEWGERLIRGGSRSIMVTPMLAATFILDAAKSASMSRLPGLVRGTWRASEARDRLNERCVYTELDLEEAVDSMKRRGGAEAMSLDDIRREGRLRLQLRGCKPLDPCPGYQQ